MNPHEHTLQLFHAALGLQEPWLITNVHFSPEEKQLRILVDFKKGAKFDCPCCGASGAKAYDTTSRTWRHLNFFEHRTDLTARHPRVKCDSCGAIKAMAVPWAAKDSRFTLLFEAYVMTLAQQMPVKAIARLVNEHDTRLWRIIKRNVQEGLSRLDLFSVKEIGLDETSSKRGHNYITVFMDLDTKRVIYVTPGKDADTVTKFVEFLQEHNGSANRITAVSCDMSRAFISGVSAEMPKAEIVFDKFHVMKLMNEAVDKVRRRETKDNPELKKNRWIWLHNPGNLSKKQSEELETLSQMNLQTGKAYRIRLALQDFFNQSSYEEAEAYLRDWYFWATHCRIEEVIKVARTIKVHWDGIMSWYTRPITNAILEGINSLIQAAKAKARGYRTLDNLITMVYLIAGKLTFNLPLPT
jgi:transposase